MSSDSLHARETPISRMPQGIATTVVVGDNNTTSFSSTKENEDSSAIPPQNCNNCNEKTNEKGGGSVSPSSSSSSFVGDSNIDEEEDDLKSYCSSGRDSGVGSSQRNNSEENRISTTPEVKESGGITSGGKVSPTVAQVDLDASFLWGASLLYFTGIPSPKLKEHHFNSSLSQSPSPSKSGSTFSLFKGRRSSGKLFRSTLSLRSSEDSDMDHNRRSTWRFGGGIGGKKFNTLPIKGTSPAVRAGPNSSFRGAGSSTAMTTPDSGFSSGTGGDTREGSPLRRRHLSCNSSTPTSSTAAGGDCSDGGLRGQSKNNTNSLRILKNVTTRPSLSTFLEKSSSLPRSPRKNRICEEIAAQQQAEAAGSIQTSSSHIMAATSPPPHTSSSGSSLKSAKKALRNSFKAAKSLLPGSSSSKIGPASGKTSLKSSKEKLSFSPCPFQDHESTNISAHNISAPNTPQVIKKSRLERARKKFASTLSLHTGGSSSSSSTNGGYTGRSKSASTLVISDSETGPGGSIPTGVVSYHHHHHRHPQNASSFSTEESFDVLAVVEGESSNFSTPSNTEVRSKSKSKSESGSKSPFRFISSRSKANKEKKSDTLPSGFGLQQEGSVKVESENSSPEANIELHSANTEAKLGSSGPTEKEKPAKKRMSLVKNFVGKTILRGGGSSSKKGDDDGSKEQQGKGEPVIFYRNSSSGGTDSETKTKRRGGFRGADQRHVEDSQEIVTFDNEPRVRTPKASRRQRLNSGSGTSGSTASSSVTCTPPPLPTVPPPATTPTYEKDREIHELEVSETSIDFTPVKKIQQHSHYDITSKRESNNDKNNEFDGDSVTAKDTSSKKTGKKSKSQSLITSLVSLSPSSAFSRGGNMEENASSGSKKKKKNFKKNSKKMGQEATTKDQQQQTVESEQLSGSQVGKEQESARESGNNNNSPVPPSHQRRRKSSEDFKELRKNGIAFVGSEKVAGDVLSEENNLPKVENNEEKILSGNTTKETVNDEEENADNNEVDETDDPETACTASFRELKPFNYDLEPVEEGKKERLYKVLVVGELGAGKTSIIKRYVHQFFSQHYRATIGVDFALKVLRWDPDTVVRLQLWDIAGQERFGSMTRVYYKEAVGAFVVFDVTRSATLEAVPKWKADLDAKVALPDGRPIPTVLLANKSDQPKEGIAANREKMNDFCQQQGFSAWFETSAKDNINIDESANFLVSKILEMDKWSQEPLAADPDKVELTANGKHKGSSSSNCAC